MNQLDIQSYLGEAEELEEILSCLDNDNDLLDLELDNELLQKYVNFIEENEQSLPHRSILKIVLHRFSCQQFLIEFPYLCGTFVHNYKEYYSTEFIPSARQSLRIHFFNHPIKTDQTGAREAICKKIVNRSWSEEELNEKYIGYTTVRPTPSYNVGRTVLPLAGELKEAHDTDAEGNPVLTCSVHEELNLLGREIKVKNAVPFLQQDPVVGACSAVSMWVTAYIFFKKFNKKQITYSEISRRGKGFPVEKGTSTPWRAGHNVYQIKNALDETGINGHIFRADSQTDWMNTLYSLQESGIPVILALTERENSDEGAAQQNIGHAVCVVGHIYESINSALSKINSNSELQDEIYINKASLQPRFYAHDDTFGPYNLFEFSPGEEGCVMKRGQANDQRKVYELRAGIVCLPSASIKVFPNEISETAEDFLHNIFADKLEPDEHRIFYRPLLIESNDFKKSLKNRNFPEVMVEFYTQNNLPRFAWLVEISLVTLETAEERLIGELLYDSTGFPYRPRLLLGRVYNKKFIYDADEGYDKAGEIENNFEPCAYKVGG